MLFIKHINKKRIPAFPAAACPPVDDAVNPYKPLPSVDVLTGSDSIPSSPMVSATILDPAGLLSKKYAAALGFGAGQAAAEASSGSERAGRAREDMKCIASFGLRLTCVPVSFAFCAWLCLGG
jgi:hypothetical protein